VGGTADPILFALLNTSKRFSVPDEETRQAECAPDSMRKLLSYCTGWLVTLSWCTYLATCSIIIGNNIKYLTLLYHPDNASVNSQWFPTIIAIFALVIGGAFNVGLAKNFPVLESLMLAIHLAGWAAVIVTLWVRKSTPPPNCLSC
jgi:choline transport protein